jgi:hypothetical protein
MAPSVDFAESVESVESVKFAELGAELEKAARQFRQKVGDSDVGRDVGLIFVSLILRYPKPMHSRSMHVCFFWGAAQKRIYLDFFNLLKNQLVKVNGPATRLQVLILLST